MADTATRESPQTKATLKYLRTSAYKVREVLDLIRGLDADLQERRRRDGTATTQRRRGVIPGRRRKAAEEAAPKAGKGKAAEAPEEGAAPAPEAEPEEAVV